MASMEYLTQQAIQSIPWAIGGGCVFIGICIVIAANVVGKAIRESRK